MIIMCRKSCCVFLVTLLLGTSAFNDHHRTPSALYKNTSTLRQKREEAPDCSYNEWRCNDGLCLRINSDCDGRVDCDDGSDETFELCRNRECEPYTFRCNYGGCIDESFPCNKIQDCADKSDELLPRCRGETIIDGEKFKCRDGQMIPKEQRCDGVVNCADGFDETVAACAELLCESEQFQCEYGGCVDAQSQCNGTIECVDGSDEKIELCGKRTLVIPTTAAPTTEAPKCTLPDQPQNGAYSVVSERNSTETDYLYLNYSCHPGYKLVGETKVLCWKGTWPDTMPHCVQTCPLIKHPSIVYECVEEETEKPRQCNKEEVEGTVVRPSCRTPNYYSPVELPYMHCHKGMWSSGPICTAECGTLPPKSTPLVLRGTTAKFGEVPWHVGIYYKYPKRNTQICGGSLISNTIVLSAAHCFWDENLRRLNEVTNYALAVGKLYREWDHPEDEPFAQKSDVSEIVVPKLYRGLDLYYKSDIAIVIASEPFKYKLYVLPVCLDFDENFSKKQLRNGYLGKAAGWGLTTGLIGSESPILKVIDLPYENYESCLNLTSPALSRYITYDDKICAGSLDGEALCRGDSGGGLAFPSSISGRMRFYLRGIASTSPPTNDQTVCNLRALTSFTSVIKFEKFIKAYWYP